MKLLVSGVAGDIGLGVGRILKEWGIFDQLFGIDISDDHPASLVFDHIKIAPKADNINYLEWVCDFIKNHNIDIFIPTSEDEIFFISNKFSFKISNNFIFSDNVISGFIFFRDWKAISI
mgnify:CR=1 FL=1